MKRVLWFLLLAACSRTAAPTERDASSASAAGPSTSAARRVVFGPDGSVSGAPRPRLAPAADSGIVQLAGLYDQLCALRSSGTIACIEYSRTAWTTVPGISDAVSFSISHGLVCAVRRTGAVACFSPSGPAFLGFQRTPTDLPGIAHAARVVTTDATACVLGADRTVACAGMGGSGMLGQRLDEATAPVSVPGVSDTVSLFGSRSATCSREARGRVLCWGVARHGVFGPVETTADGPVEMVGLRGATDIALTDSYACAVLGDGGVACWGDHPGLNGDDPVGPWNFQRIYGLHDAVGLSLESQAACVLRGDGHVTCFGFNHNGELGDGTNQKRFGVTDDTVIPRTLLDIVSLAGQPDDGIAPSRPKRRPGPRSNHIVDVVGVSDAVAIANDESATCALRKTGALACWGRGLPGTGDRSDVAKPSAGPP